MKIQRHKLLKIASTGAAGLAFANAVQAATTLTGDGQANNTTVVATHGSNEVGTPNIALTWDADWESWAGWTNDSSGNGVYQHDLAPGGTHTIIFTPDIGFNVSLSDLDLNVFNGGGDTDVTWEITGSLSGVLGTGTITALTDTNTNLALNLTGSDQEALTLALTQDTGLGSYLAIDNLTFDQEVAIPETSTTLIAAAGLGAMAMRRRRKSRA